MTFGVNVVGCIIFQILVIMLEVCFLAKNLCFKKKNLTIEIQDITGTGDYKIFISKDTPAAQIYVPPILLGFCGMFLKYFKVRQA